MKEASLASSELVDKPTPVEMLVQETSAARVEALSRALAPNPLLVQVLEPSEKDKNDLPAWILMSRHQSILARLNADNGEVPRFVSPRAIRDFDSVYELYSSLVHDRRAKDSQWLQSLITFMATKPERQRARSRLKNLFFRISNGRGHPTLNTTLTHLRDALHSDGPVNTSIALAAILTQNLLELQLANVHERTVGDSLAVESDALSGPFRNLDLSNRRAYDLLDKPRPVSIDEYIAMIANWADGGRKERERHLPSTNLQRLQLLTTQKETLEMVMNGLTNEQRTNLSSKLSELEQERVQLLTSGAKDKDLRDIDARIHEIKGYVEPLTPKKLSGYQRIYQKCLLDLAQIDAAVTSGKQELNLSRVGALVIGDVAENRREDRRVYLVSAADHRRLGYVRLKTLHEIISAMNHSALHIQQSRMGHNMARLQEVIDDVNYRLYNIDMERVHRSLPAIID